MALLIVINLLLCLSIFAIFFVLQRHITSRNNTKLPPGPQGLPFVGNLHQLDVSKPPVSFWELSKKYGPLMSLRLGFVPSLVVSSAKMAKEILKAHDLQFCSGPALGTQFSAHREDEVSRMIEKISKLVVASKPLNLSEVTMSLTSTIVVREDEATSERSYFPFIGWIDKLTGMLQRPQNNFQEIDKQLQQEDVIDVLLQIRKDRGFKVDLTMDHIKVLTVDNFINS
ncbi:hypothetical protein CUMW_231720 [Citrus unshiu]|uniref:Cytochrome P450 n=1 Tax=Citrus unshiu TaxID=55188 RepID=A0A2H5QHV5_CITUN|nr:hypothetical protein CUMW_231720 [Citrus unshiu]